MNEGLIPRRYAKALYKVAIDRDDSKALYATMKALLEAFGAEKNLSAVIANPFVSENDKRGLIMTAAGASERDVTFCDFIKLLARNRRTDIVADIARAYTDIYRRANNVYRVETVSAAPLSGTEDERIKNLILSHLNGGTMEYSNRTDPDIIGGFIINIDNERLDASIRNELKQLRLKLIK